MLTQQFGDKKEAMRGTALMDAKNDTYLKEWRNQGKGSFITYFSAVHPLMHPLFEGTQSKERLLPLSLHLP